MADEKLLNLIRQSRQTGASEGQIRQSLLDLGWQIQDIQEAFDYLESTPAESSLRLFNSGRKSFKPIIIFAAIVALLGGYFVSAKFVFNLWPFDKSSVETQKPENMVTPMGKLGPMTGEANFATVKLATIPDKYKAIDPVFSPNGISVAYTAQELIVYAEKKGLCTGESFYIKALLEKNPDYEKQWIAQYGDSIKKEIQKVKTEENYGLCSIERTFVVLNNKNGQVESKRYDAINFVNFSPDGSKLAYIAKEKKESFVVVEDKEGKRYDNIVGQSYEGITYGAGNVVFSPDSQRIAYVASKSNKSFVVVDGAEGKPYDWVEYLTFSPDGKKVVYAAGESKASFMVVDGQEGKRYADVQLVRGPCIGCTVGRPVFNPANSSVAYTAHVGGKYVVVVDGRESASYDYVYGIAFSPISGRVFYSARVGERRFVIEDGKENKTYASLPTFSPDGKRFAYIGTKKNQKIGRTDYYVNLDGKEGKSYFSVKNLVFSPDSRTIAYIAELRWPEIRGNAPGTFVVVGEKEGKRYNSINFGPGSPTPSTPPLFSPDSKKIAYYAELNQKGFVVVGDKEFREKNGRPASYPIFRQDSKKVAYGAWVGLEKYPASTELWWISVSAE